MAIAAGFDGAQHARKTTLGENYARGGLGYVCCCRDRDASFGLPFRDMKLAGSSAVSLGKAIEQLSPQAKAKTQAKKAKKQASDDPKASSS